jgi:hypothetical protein
VAATPAIMAVTYCRAMFGKVVTCGMKPLSENLTDRKCARSATMEVVRMDDAFIMRQPPDATTPPAQVAAYWASAGFPVFPCEHDKRPLTPHGFKDATTDMGAVAAYWQAYPKALVGLATGAASGLFVVDLDTDRETGEAVGEASLAALGYHALVGTVPTVLTPSGGLHLYFPDCGLGNSTGKMGLKIDTRGNGGYVIAPGSVTPSGAYVLRNGPITLDRLKGVPEDLIARLKDDTAKKPPRDAMHIDTPARARWAETALHREIGRVMAAQKGERNDTLNSAEFSLGQIVAGGELDEASARQQLLRAGLAIDLPESEAAATIVSGMKAGFKSPRSPKGRGGETRTPGAGTDETAEAEGPQPLLRAIPKGADYPVDALGPLRAAVEAVQGETLAPVAIP